MDWVGTELIANGKVLAAGFGVGLFHALDADHLAAVSTMMVKRRSLWRSALIGGWWGLGHMLALLAAGVLVILLQFRISLEFEHALEFGVGVMLVALGLNVLRHIFVHRAYDAAQPHSHVSVTTGMNLGWRPLLIGLVHGMAGSAALLFLAVNQLNATSQKFLFLAVFGIGSIGGMMLMSMLLGLPAYWTAQRHATAHHALRALAGGFSLCVGAWMIYEIGFVKGLFARLD
jgi:sulfite exporter TauE/SafE